MPNQRNQTLMGNIIRLVNLEMNGHLLSQEKGYLIVLLTNL